MKAKLAPRDHFKNSRIEILYDGGELERDRILCAAIVVHGNMLEKGKNSGYFIQSDTLKDKIRWSSEYPAISEKEKGNEHFLMLEFWCNDDIALEFSIEFEKKLNIRLEI